MGHQTFNDSQTQLDINGPLLSFTQDPSTSTSMLTVSPATSDGDTISEETVVEEGTGDFASDAETVLSGDIARYSEAISKLKPLG